ncbi:MAG TPA: ABC transporter permease, partial [Aggregatilineales bacterium]|nr:ABC transporter permease [Aggregatilineales bacterium]
SGLLALLLDGSDLAALVAQGPQPNGFALPAVLSPRYAAQHNLTIGQKFALNINQATLWFRVDAVAPYFPTLIDADELYVVTDYAGLSRMLALRPRGYAGGNEAWIGLADGASGEAWLNALVAVPEAAGFVAAQTRTGVLDTLRTDLLTTGLIGLLLLGFVIALTLCVVSLATYTGITLQARRGEFAVLHALGWQRRQIVFSILTEQVMVMVVGVTLGLVIGVLLSAQVLPGLGGSDTGNVLPYIVRPDPGSLLLYVALMAALFGLQMAFGALTIRRQTAQVLRRGDSE